MNSCLVCGESTKNAKFCSRRCSGVGGSGNLIKRETKYTEVACENCGTVMSLTGHSKPKTRRFCSRSCSVSLLNSESPKRMKTAQTRTCFVCGSFSGVNKYCSSKCRAALRVTVLSARLQNGDLSDNAARSPACKAFILQEQDSKCAICGMPNVWMGRPLILILDHIDGNSENNNRENLRLVCSNCDSQLSTYKARNKGNGRQNRLTLPM